MDQFTFHVEYHKKIHNCLNSLLALSFFRSHYTQVKRATQRNFLEGARSQLLAHWGEVKQWSYVQSPILTSVQYNKHPQLGREWVQTVAPLPRVHVHLPWAWGWLLFKPKRQKDSTWEWNFIKAPVTEQPQTTLFHIFLCLFPTPFLRTILIALILQIEFISNLTRIFTGFVILCTPCWSWEDGNGHATIIRWTLVIDFSCIWDAEILHAVLTI